MFNFNCGGIYLPNDSSVINIGSGTGALDIIYDNSEEISGCTTFDISVIPVTHSMVDIIEQGQGTLYCEFNCVSQIGVVGLLTLSDGTLDNRIHVFLTASGVVGVISVVGGVTEAEITGVTIDYGLINKVAVTYIENDMRLYLNGVDIGVDISAGIPMNLNQIDIGVDLIGEIYDARYCTTVFSNVQAIKLTKSIYIQDEFGNILFDDDSPLIELQLIGA